MKQTIAFYIALIALTGCDNNDSYTLYRNSLLDPNMRIHVASFDSKDGDAYNRENCEIASNLFQGQPDVKTKFWCEKGRYKNWNPHNLL